MISTLNYPQDILTILSTILHLPTLFTVSYCISFLIKAWDCLFCEVLLRIEVWNKHGQVLLVILIHVLRTIGMGFNISPLNGNFGKLKVLFMKKVKLSISPKKTNSSKWSIFKIWSLLVVLDHHFRTPVFSVTLILDLHFQEEFNQYDIHLKLGLV